LPLNPREPDGGRRILPENSNNERARSQGQEQEQQQLLQ
jgi:hypothetical protein